VSAPAFSPATVRKLLDTYEGLQAPPGWTFTAEIVPNLAHQGKPAWATVESDTDAKTAKILVRDLAKTPIPNVADPWRELNLTIAHELGHVNVAEFVARPTLEAEEDLVERWARSIVDAPAALRGIVARGWRAAFDSAPVAVRARLVKISARDVRARGGSMDGKAVLEAIEGKDAASALEILKGWVAEQIEMAQGASGAPAPEAAPVDGGATDMRGAPMPPKPGAKPADGEMPESTDEARVAARKAREAKMDEENKALRARQVAATTEAEKSAGILRITTIRARIAEARTVDRATISAEAEKLILASPSIDEAEIRLTLARGSAATTTQRARAVDKDGKPVEVQAVEAEGANVDGLSPSDLALIDSLGGPKSSAGKQYAVEAQKVRARLAAGAQS
jgi:hypothetical protein